MCVNFETSLASFIIGESSGLVLIGSKEKEKIIIGLFVMFYSLIQFFETNIYFGNDTSSIYSRLLLINLGFQGLIFFVLMTNLYEINNFYIIISSIISIYIMFEACKTDFSKANIDSCLTWNFMNNSTSVMLGAMYLLMFIWYYNNKIPLSTDISTKYINNTGILFFITFIVSYLLLNIKNSPSFWCMISAIVAPIFIIM